VGLQVFLDMAPDQPVITARQQILPQLGAPAGLGLANQRVDDMAVIDAPCTLGFMCVHPGQFENLDMRAEQLQPLVIQLDIKPFADKLLRY
jgi:hypothetical protein